MSENQDDIIDRERLKESVKETSIHIGKFINWWLGEIHKGSWLEILFISDSS